MNSKCYLKVVQADGISRKCRLVVNNEKKSLILNNEIPLDYQKVEYIQSTGEQYIDTGVPVNDNNSFDITFARVSNTTGIYLLSIRLQTPGFYWFTKNYNFSGSAPTDTFINIKCGYNYCTLNEEDLTGNSDTDTVTGNTVWLFAKNTGESFTSAKVKNLKIYNPNNVLVRDLIPCYRKDNNTIGMYDIINNKFYINNGSGDFIKGSDI